MEMTRSLVCELVCENLLLEPTDVSLVTVEVSTRAVSVTWSLAGVQLYPIVVVL